MEKIFNHIDIVIIALVALVLLGVLIRLLGTQKGLQRSDFEEHQKLTGGKITSSLRVKNNTKSNEVAEVIQQPIGSLNYKINKLKGIVPSFDYKNFIRDCKSSFISVVENFSEKNISAVKNKLSENLFSKLNGYLNVNSEKTQHSTRVLNFLIVDIEDIIFEDCAQPKNSSLEGLTSYRSENDTKSSVNSYDREKVKGIIVKFYSRQNKNNLIQEMKEKWTFIPSDTNGWVVDKIMPSQD